MQGFRIYKSSDEAMIMAMIQDEKLQQYIPIERIQYLDRQEALFEQCKPELLLQFEGEFVAFEEGNVLDHDVNERALAARAYRPTGTPLIRQVIPGERRIVIGGVRTSMNQN